MSAEEKYGLGGLAVDRPDLASTINQVSTAANLTEHQQVRIDPNRAVSAGQVQEQNVKAAGASEANLKDIASSRAALTDIKQQISEPTGPSSGGGITPNIVQSACTALVQVGIACATGSAVVWPTLGGAGMGAAWNYTSSKPGREGSSKEMGSDYGYEGNSQYGVSAYGKDGWGGASGTTPAPVGSNSDVSAFQKGMKAIVGDGPTLTNGDAACTGEFLSGIERLEADLDKCEALAKVNMENTGLVAAALKQREGPAAPSPEKGPGGVLDREQDLDEEPKPEEPDPMAMNMQFANLSGGMAI